MKGYAHRIDRREFLKKAAIGGTTLMGLGLIGCTPAAPPPAPTATKPAAPPTPSGPAATPTPSEAERVAQLVEGAKKEGAVQAYFTGTVEDAQAIEKVFGQKYPFLKIESFTGTDEVITNKILTEARAGKTVADYMYINSSQMALLLKQGLVMKYDSPERKSYPDMFKDKEGYWTIRRLSLHGMVYNTKLVPKAEAPKTWEDLLNPKWKDKMGIEANCYEWFTYTMKMMGGEKGLDFMRKLGQQNLSLRKGHSTLMRTVAAGELHIGVMVYQDVTQREMDKGAPVQWVLVNPVSSAASPCALLKDAPHPNAGKLYMDWILSEEGTKLVDIRGRRTPTRTGLKPDPPSLIDGVQFNPPDPNIGEDMTKNEKLFLDIFGSM